MKLRIIGTTDGQFLGHEFTDKFPIILGGSTFSPDTVPQPLGGNAWRFHNSNYQIDAEEV